MRSDKGQHLPRVAHLLGHLVSCVVLTGCVVLSNPEYPSEWASLQSNYQNCRHIAGTYKNAGERVREGNWGSSFDSLSQLLGRYKAWPTATRPDRVRIAFAGDETLTTEAWEGNRLVASIRFSANTDDFHCVDASIEFTRSEVVAEQVAGMQSETIRISKASDGSLVLKYSTAGFGLIGGILPAGGNGRSWSRFAPMDPH